MEQALSPLPVDPKLLVPLVKEYATTVPAVVLTSEPLIFDSSFKRK